MKRLVLPLVALMSLAVPISTYAADDDKPTTDKPAVDKPATPTPSTGNGNTDRGQGGRFAERQRGQNAAGTNALTAMSGPGGLFLNRDPLEEIVATLGETNLGPDFNLSADQKQQIQAVRDDFKKQMDKWRADHDADLKKLQEQAAQAVRNNAGQGGGGNRGSFQEIAQSRQELQATAPNSDEAVVQIKAILSTEQLKKFEAKQAERQAELARQRRETANRLLGGANGGAKGNRGGANGAAPGGAGGGNRRGGGGQARNGTNGL